MVSVIDSHPMRATIINMILAGHSLREIARLVTPPVSIMALHRYRSKTVVPALRNADEKTKVLAGTEVMPSGKRMSSIPKALSEVTEDALIAAPILAVREKRLRALQDRHERLNLVMRERAEEMDGETAGGASGLLARKRKMIGQGANAHEVTEYELDTGLLAEFREHEKQAAIELGQWQENARTSGGPDITLAVMVQIPRASAEPRQLAPVDVEFTPAR